MPSNKRSCPTATGSAGTGCSSCSGGSFCWSSSSAYGKRWRGRGSIPAAFIGQPSKFLPLLVEGVLDGKIAVAAVDTLSATLMAFVLGGILALATALMLAVYPTVKELIDPTSTR